MLGSITLLPTWFIRATNNDVFHQSNYRLNSFFRFVPPMGPIIPIDQSNPDPALDMERASDAFIKVPLMLGVSTAESYLDFNAEDIQFGFEEDQRNRILRTFIRNTYYYHLNEIFSSVKNEYTDWDKPILHPINIRDSTMEALSDGHTVAPLMRIAFYHARRGANTYFFHFNYQTKDSDYPQVCLECNTFPKDNSFTETFSCLKLSFNIIEPSRFYV